jgi:hypothetical protein
LRHSLQRHRKEAGSMSSNLPLKSAYNLIGFASSKDRHTGHVVGGTMRPTLIRYRSEQCNPLGIRSAAIPHTFPKRIAPNRVCNENRRR